MKSTSEYLYAIVDTGVATDPVGLADRALRAGCTALQLRAKETSDSEFLSLAKTLVPRCRSAGVPFVVNDRADIAVLVGADGLHLGQDDMAIADARTIVGGIDIGVSTHTLDQAKRAQEDGADRVAFGPIFRTATKRDPDPVVGLATLRQVREIMSLPLVAIGGITRQSAPDVLSAGADQVAAISALPAFLE